jgi:predicted transcriptional regulator
VWLYSTLPVGKIVGVGVLKGIIEGSPDALWNRFSHCAGLDQEAFEGYFGQLSRGIALMFSEIAPLREPIELHALRSIKSNFHPPQFYQWIRHRELAATLNAAPLGAAFVACDH